MQNFENALDYCKQVQGSRLRLGFFLKDLTHGLVFDQVNSVSEHA
jgi:hypothetical protein